MNKKGFTLSELIGVIVLLGIIALISVPIINGVINNSKQKAYNTQIDVVLKAAKSWAVENTSLLPKEPAPHSTMVCLSSLVDSKYIEESKVINPKTEEPLGGCVKITYVESSKSYTYEYTTTGCVGCVIPE